MDGLEIRTTVVADGSRLPLSQFRDKPRFAGLLTAILTELQTLETAIVESVEARYLANATGWALDRIGDLVGIERPTYGDATNNPDSTADDDIYRILIRGQIAASVSYGTTPELYQILQALSLTGGQIYDIYPAAISVQYLDSELAITYEFLRDILERATHPIEIDITHLTETPFGFAGDDSALGLGVGHLGGAE
jgi:hypothetical protein